jgi:hypothetical protein
MTFGRNSKNGLRENSKSFSWCFGSIRIKWMTTVLNSDKYILREQKIISNQCNKCLFLCRSLNDDLSNTIIRTQHWTVEYQYIIYWLHFKERCVAYFNKLCRYFLGNFDENWETSHFMARVTF